MQIASRSSYSGLIDLDWSRPLGRWKDPRLVRMARGRSRHMVRFVELEGKVFAVKELDDRLAVKEYEMLKEMADSSLPAVEVACVVVKRTTPDGEPLDGAVVTRFLDYALPYTYLLRRDGWSQSQKRLIDAAAVLLVQLHLEGFWWGDFSLGNALFRRDAGELRAYLVDAETAERHEKLSDGQRRYDVDIAVENMAGGLADLVAGGKVKTDVDPIDVALQLAERYEALWAEVTSEEEFSSDELWRLEDRVRRLNALGFDASELSVVSLVGKDRIRIRPLVVEEGHHGRRLARLTGINVQENQARRLLNDLDFYRAELERDRRAPLSEAIAAHRWMTERFEPFVMAIPPDLAGRLEPAEAYHQYLEHRWFLSEAAGHDVSDAEAMRSFFDSVLRPRPEEKLVFDEPTQELPISWLTSPSDNPPTAGQSRIRAGTSSYEPSTSGSLGGSTQDEDTEGNDPEDTGTQDTEDRPVISG